MKTGDVGQRGTHRAARRHRPLLPTLAAIGLMLGGGTAVAVGVAGPEPERPPSLADVPRASTSGDDTVSPRTLPMPATVDTDVPAVQDSREPAVQDSGLDRQNPEESEPAPPVDEPTSVSIPAIGVTSDLLHLGLDDQGALEVPEGEDYDSAAWYDGSPRPGEPGPAVVLGHVSGAAGPSVFFDLALLQVGDTVEVDRADGTTATFEIYDLQQFPKDTFPTLAVYGNTPGPELRLITCAGTFDDDTGHYDDNIIVYAREA